MQKYTMSRFTRVSTSSSSCTPIVYPDVNGHRKLQIELYREPTNTVSFSNFIDPRLT